MKVALFGAGRIGKVHAASIRMDPRSELVAVTDLVTDAADALAREHGILARTSDEILGDGGIDAILIASSTNTHADLIEAGVRAGKAVFCEKPVSLDFAQVAEATRAVEAAGIRCMLGFQRRYDPSFRAVRARIASGEAGRLEHLTMTSRDPAPPSAAYVKTSGGMFRDTAIHDMDMCRFLLAEEVATVYATASCLISPEIGEAGDVDTLMITLTTASGRMAHVTNCRRGPLGYDQRLEALCAREILSVGNRPGTTMRIAGPHGETVAPPINYFIERFADAYRDELADFVRLVRDGTTPLSGIRDGYEAQRLIEAAIASTASGQVVAYGPDWVPEAAQ